MKKILPVLLIVALIPLAVWAKSQAKITFAETTYNFGTISENGGKVTHTFKFTNTGDANLVITDATAECGCTEPKYPAQPIKPGGTGTITVTYNPKYRPGPFVKNITVRSNASNKKVVIKIKGTVK